MAAGSARRGSGKEVGRKRRAKGGRCEKAPRDRRAGAWDDNEGDDARIGHLQPLATWGEGDGPM